MELKELTKLLCRAAGPSGFEQPVFKMVKDYLEPFADEIRSDALGNLIAIKRCGRENAKLIMLNAHMDEIGLIVTGIQDGFLRFATLGGVDQRMLPAREVRILSDPPLYGVIDTLAPHLLDKDAAEKAFEIDKLFIDIGMDQTQAEKAVPLGTPVVFASGCEEPVRGKLCGKALDDRSCAAIVMKAFELLSAREELSVDLCCFISTQEEVGHRGAFVGAWQIRPDTALVVDVTHAKTPDAGDIDIRCGKGVVIEYGPNMNRSLTDSLVALAQDRELGFQIGVSAGGNSGTDAHAIQISRQGVATALLSLPLKYMHTPVEMVSLEDMSSIQRLICEFVLEGGEYGTDA